MQNSEQMVNESVAFVLDQIGRDALDLVRLEPISLNEISWHLAHLSHLIAPSYLPFARYSDGYFALHLWPSRPLDRSPIVTIHDDSQDANFLCHQLASLPTGVFLWIGRYYKNKPTVLRKAIDMLTSSIPDAQSVSDDLWNILESAPESTPTWWSADCDEFTSKAWSIGKINHPFVGLPNLDQDTSPKDALLQLEDFIREHREPELIGIWLAAQIKAKQPCQPEDVIAVLSAEAWRQISSLLYGYWRVNGKGRLREWDCILRYLPNSREILENTPFASLIDHPETYSGADPQGPLILSTIAADFRDHNDPENALRQLRNAANVAIFALGQYPEEIALASAGVCDAIEKDSLAAAVARRSVQIDRNAL